MRKIFYISLHSNWYKRFKIPEFLLDNIYKMIIWVITPEEHGENEIWQPKICKTTVATYEVFFASELVASSKVAPYSSNLRYQALTQKWNAARTDTNPVTQTHTIQLRVVRILVAVCLLQWGHSIRIHWRWNWKLWLAYLVACEQEMQQLVH